MMQTGRVIFQSKIDSVSHSRSDERSRHLAVVSPIVEENPRRHFPDDFLGLYFHIHFFGSVSIKGSGQIGGVFGYINPFKIFNIFKKSVNIFQGQLRSVGWSESFKKERILEIFGKDLRRKKQQKDSDTQNGNGNGDIPCQIKLLETAYKIIKIKAMTATAKMKKPRLCNRAYFIIKINSYIFLNKKQA